MNVPKIAIAILAMSDLQICYVHICTIILHVYTNINIKETKHSCINTIRLKNDCYLPIRHSLLINKLTIWINSISSIYYMYSAGFFNDKINM